MRSCDPRATPVVLCDPLAHALAAEGALRIRWGVTGDVRFELVYAPEPTQTFRCVACPFCGERLDRATT